MGGRPQGHSVESVGTIGETGRSRRVIPGRFEGPDRVKPRHRHSRGLAPIRGAIIERAAPYAILLDECVGEDEELPRFPPILPIALVHCSRRY